MDVSNPLVKCNGSHMVSYLGPQKNRNCPRLGGCLKDGAWQITRLEVTALQFSYLFVPLCYIASIVDPKGYDVRCFQIIPQNVHVGRLRGTNGLEICCITHRT